jgi:hypothetical protein
MAHNKSKETYHTHAHKHTCTYDFLLIYAHIYSHNTGKLTCKWQDVPCKTKQECEPGGYGTQQKRRNIPYTRTQTYIFCIYAHTRTHTTGKLTCKWQDVSCKTKPECESGGVCDQSTWSISWAINDETCKLPPSDTKDVYSKYGSGCGDIGMGSSMLA